VTYADLETRRTVVLAGLEPEDEAGAIFLRLRKAVRPGAPAVVASRRLHARPAQDGGQLVADRARREAAALDALGTHGDFGIDATA
jgi:NADH-quinone oxidoreductase subunit G